MQTHFRVSEYAVHRGDIQGDPQRNDINSGEGYLEWNFRFSESWRSFGIDGALGKRKDYASEPAWRSVERADPWWYGHLQRATLLQVLKKQVII